MSPLGRRVSRPARRRQPHLGRGLRRGGLRRRGTAAAAPAGRRLRRARGGGLRWSEPDPRLAGLLDLEEADEAIRTAAVAELDRKTKPRRSLGRLEDLAAQVAAIRGTLRPEPLRAAIVVAAADHGIAAEGVSAYPQEVTRQMVANFVARRRGRLRARPRGGRRARRRRRGHRGAVRPRRRQEHPGRPGHGQRRRRAGDDP